VRGRRGGMRIVIVVVMPILFRRLEHIPLEEVRSLVVGGLLVPSPFAPFVEH